MFKGVSKGFSLMELVLVVAIMAILAGVMTPMIFASREAAREAKAMAELDAISTACRAFYGDYNSLFGVTLDVLVAQGYLSENKDNPWGKDYGLYVAWVDSDSDGVPEAGTDIIAYTKKTANPAFPASLADAQGSDFHMAIIDM